MERIKKAEETLAAREDELEILTRKPDSKQPVSAGEVQKLTDKLNAHANRVKWDGGYFSKARAAIGAGRTLRQWRLANEFLDSMMECTDGYWGYVDGPYLNELRKQRDGARTHEERGRLSLLIGDGMNKAAKDYKTCADIASATFVNAWRETLGP